MDTKMDTNVETKMDTNVGKMDTNINTILLPGKINKQAVIQFINKYHVQECGNSTLLTEYNYDTFSRLGTVMSYLTENNKIVGSVFSIVLNLNIGKSSYTTYLCLNPTHRGQNKASTLIQSTIQFGAKYLNVNHGYYLGIKSRRKGCIINSWYRILDIPTMKDSGFGMLENNRKAKLKYKIKQIEHLTVKKGLHMDSVKDNKRAIYWNPDDKELNRYSSNLNFYTIFKNNVAVAVFVLFPLDCIIGSTGKKVNMGMLSYYYSIDNNDNDNMKTIFHTAKEEGYSCLYGYIIGDINKDLVITNGCHITDIDFWLDFYNHPNDNISPEHINVLLF